MRSTRYFFRFGKYLVLFLVAGCAGTAHTHARLTRVPEVLCKHCNCLMPANLDPESLCPVCNCGMKVHQCIRGH